ncbi:MAG: RNA polymerase sigma factor [Gammaproteobacteria bacterium]
MATQRKHDFVAGIAARYGARLRRFLKLRLSNASDVPDLAQEVFMRLMRVENHEEIRSPEAYLFTVASHVVHQHSQRHAAMPESVDITDVFVDLQLISRDDPAVKVELSQRLQELERALESLPPRVAMALLMQRLGGKSIDEISRELGVAQITAKKYLAKALLHCRDMCGNEGRDTP